MAALTITGLQHHSIGNLRAATGSVVIAADGDTAAVGLTLILWVGITTRTAAAGEVVQATFSGGTITFKVEGGTPTLDFVAIGV